MSTTTLTTAQQPTFSIQNVTGHPGSTFAGIAALVGTVLATIGQNGPPTSMRDWIALAVVALTSAGAVFGK